MSDAPESRLLIDGKLTDAQSGRSLANINPATVLTPELTAARGSRCGAKWSINSRTESRPGTIQRSEPMRITPSARSAAAVTGTETSSATTS